MQESRKISVSQVRSAAFTVKAQSTQGSDGSRQAGISSIFSFSPSLGNWRRRQGYERLSGVKGGGEQAGEE